MPPPEASDIDAVIRGVLGPYVGSREEVPIILQITAVTPKSSERRGPEIRPDFKVLGGIIEIRCHKEVTKMGGRKNIWSAEVLGRGTNLYVAYLHQLCKSSFSSAEAMDAWLKNTVSEIFCNVGKVETNHWVPLEHNFGYVNVYLGAPDGGGHSPDSEDTRGWHPSHRNTVTTRTIKYGEWRDASFIGDLRMLADFEGGRFWENTETAGNNMEEE